MRIAVISDTHQERPTTAFRAVFDRHLAGADLLLHCGDITGHEVWRYLEASHPAFHAVLGNCDGGPLLGRVPAVRTLSVGAPHLPPESPLVIGMIHGYGPRSQVHLAALEALPGCGLVCFGHTHVPLFQQVRGSWLLNPGSLRMGAGDRPSLALVDILPGQPPSARHVYVDEE